MSIYAQGASRGGSNYNWFGQAGNSPAAYYNIANFDLDSSTINSQLANIFANGQRTLRIGIYHIHGGERCSGSRGTRGTNLDSTGGELSPQCTTNLQHFLAAIRENGLTVSEIGFFPQGPNGAVNWPSGWSSDPVYESLFEENWNLIYNLHSIFVNSGFNFKIDLANESLPVASQTGLIEYTSTLWNNYTYVFGRADTVGFSVPCDTGTCLDRLQQMNAVYGSLSNYPPVFDFHFYGSAATVYAQAWSYLKSLGAVQGWIIGEAYYDNSLEAQNLSAAQRSAGNLVFFLCQWPMDTSLTWVNPAPDFSGYADYGW